MRWVPGRSPGARMPGTGRFVPSSWHGRGTPRRCSAAWTPRGRDLVRRPERRRRKSHDRQRGSADRQGRSPTSFPRHLDNPHNAPVAALLQPHALAHDGSSKNPFLTNNAFATGVESVYRFSATPCELPDLVGETIPNLFLGHLTYRVVQRHSVESPAEMSPELLLMTSFRVA